MKQLLFLLPVILGACANEPPRYSNSVVTAQQASKDQYECERDARNIRGTACEQMRLYMRCMSSKGYEPVAGTGSTLHCAYQLR